MTFEFPLVPLTFLWTLPLHWDLILDNLCHVIIFHLKFCNWKETHWQNWTCLLSVCNTSFNKFCNFEHEALLLGQCAVIEERCLEVVGSPKEVEEKILEGKVLSIFGKVVYNIKVVTSKKSHNVIIQFSRRTDCRHILRVKMNLRHYNPEDLSFHGENKIYINRSLCQYYRILRSKSKNYTA